MRAALVAVVAMGVLGAAFGAGVLARPHVAAVVRSVVPAPVTVSPRATQHDPSGAFDLVMLGDSLSDHGRWAELGDWRVANRGLGGDTVAMAAARVGTLPEGPVALMVGINDLGRSRSVDAVAADYDALLDRLGDRPVIVQSVLGPASLPVTELNGRLRALAEARGHSWLDLTPVLGHPIRPDYTYDGIHLTAPAYAAWAQALREVVPDR